MALGGSGQKSLLKGDHFIGGNRFMRRFGFSRLGRLGSRNRRDGGAPGLHFYTLNQASLTTIIWQRLSL